MKDQLWFQAVFAGLEQEKAKQEQEVVEAKETSVSSGSCEKGEKVKPGREGEGEDGAEEVTQTLKARRVMESGELERGEAPHAEEESRLWEADENGWRMDASTDFEDFGRDLQKCKHASAPKSARVHATPAHPRRALIKCLRFQL